MSIQLSIAQQGIVKKSVTLTGEMLLGRSSECQIRLEDRAVSRKQALFRVSETGVYVENKSSFSPLKVNGMVCQSATLKEGDCLELGPYEIRWATSIPSSEVLVKESLPLVTEVIQEKKEQALPSVLESPAEAIDPGAPDLLMNPIGVDAVIQEFQSLPEDSKVSSAPAVPQQESEGFVTEQAPPPTKQEESEIPEADGATQVGAASQLSVRLIFPAGAANVSVLDLSKKEQVILGRGRDCDVILNDKKASRKNTLIHKKGIRFFLKDLDSVNGTWVNGQQIQEHLLVSHDQIQIGTTVFEFRALSKDYEQQKQDFLSVPETEEKSVALELNQSLASAPAPEALGVVGPIPGIQLGASSTSGKSSLMERFRALPKRTQVIVIILVVLGGSWLMEDDPVSEVKKSKSPKSVPSPKSSIKSEDLRFEMLVPEKQKFIEMQHRLAFDHYKNREYDKALFEIEKIFSLLPDYKDAREIQRYALEGKRKMEALEEERRKQEEEARLKEKILSLEQQTQKAMAAKNYEKARSLFMDILSIDPENTHVMAWKKEIEAYEESLRLKEQQNQVEKEINERAKKVYWIAMEFKKNQKYHSAITHFKQVVTIHPTHQVWMLRSQKMIKICQAMIQQKVIPLVQQAQKFESDLNYLKAYEIYQKLTRVDPPNPVGYAGMQRIRKFLHDQAKVKYTEGILAESYSDFETAKKLFKDCMQIAPAGDLYHERAQRKLAHYFQSELQTANSGEQE